MSPQMKNPKLMKRKELVAEVERLRIQVQSATNQHNREKKDALTLNLLRVRYRLMTVRLRERMAKKDPMFHNILMELDINRD